VSSTDSDDIGELVMDLLDAGARAPSSVHNKAAQSRLLMILSRELSGSDQATCPRAPHARPSRTCVPLAPRAEREPAQHVARVAGRRAQQ
jgi:hypothetical protein